MAPQTTALVRAEPPAERPADIVAELMVQRYIARGPHPEYRAFEQAAVGGNVSGARKRQTILASINSWSLIEDAVEARGGFVDGNYLVPHKREIQGAQLIDKFWERVETTVYSGFAKTIAYGPWNYIAQASDLVQRSTDNEALDVWWGDVDGTRQAIQNFVEYPASQARLYGSGWIFMDRPAAIGGTQLDNLDPANAPRVWCVPTKSVVDWQYGPDRKLTAVTVLEQLEGYEGAPNAENFQQLRVWTRASWNTYAKDGETWVWIDGRANTLGRVPAVVLFDETAKPGSALGRSCMLAVARLARKHYNLASEARELERKCAFAMLAVAMADPTKANTMTVGTDSLLPFAPGSVLPAWIEPQLTSLDKLFKDMEDTRAEAFGIAQMGALMGFDTVVKTASGFHDETQFDKTNRAIGTFAAALEKGEVELANLFLDFLNPARPATTDEFKVSYPRDFGLRDLEQYQMRVQARLDMHLGEADAAEAIEEFYTVLHPRDTQDDLKTRAQAAAKALYEAASGSATVGPLSRAVRLFAKVKANAGMLPASIAPGQTPGGPAAIGAAAAGAKG